MPYDNILVEIGDGVALVRLNRPQALNALNDALLAELVTALQALDADPAVGCIVLTGSDKAFAAGADIKEMADKTFAEMFTSNGHGGAAAALNAVRKPIIAAVAGFALGGGCELALMCDFIIAADNARFGQPEASLGIIPGIGGTQRLSRLVGKSKAMDMILTGRLMDAAEAERSGLVSRVVALADLQSEAMAAARAIAGKAPLAVLAAKEAVNRAAETGLAEGLLFERRLFTSLFATGDQKEGMAAFIAKRPPVFHGN